MEINLKKLKNTQNTYSVKKNWDRSFESISINKISVK